MTLLWVPMFYLTQVLAVTIWLGNSSAQINMDTRKRSILLLLLDLCFGFKTDNISGVGVDKIVEHGGAEIVDKVTYQ